MLTNATVFEPLDPRQFQLVVLAVSSISSSSTAFCRFINLERMDRARGLVILEKLAAARAWSWVPLAGEVHLE